MDYVNIIELRFSPSFYYYIVIKHLVDQKIAIKKYFVIIYFYSRITEKMIKPMSS